MAELEKFGFEKATPSGVQRIMVCSSAQEKCGKTHWAMTAPGPIAVISLDAGTQEVVDKFCGLKTIYVHYNRVPVKREVSSNDDYVRLWKTVSEAIMAAIRDPAVRTMVVDTATEVWELCRLAHFGKLSQVMPHQYAIPNKAMRDLIKAAYERRDLNSIWIHKVRKEYSGDRWTGQWEFSGFSDMPYLADVRIEHYVKLTSVGAVFGMRVLGPARQNPNVANLELEGDLCNFPSLACALYPDVDASFWM